MKRHCRRRGGRKVRASRKGGHERQLGDRYSAVNLIEQITSNGNGTNEARRQHAWGRGGNNRAMVPPQSAAGAARGGRWNMVGVRRRGGATSTHGAVAPVAMVVAAAPPGGEGPTENPGGWSGPIAFLDLMDSTQLAVLAPDSQGVVSLTNKENWGGGRLDNTTNGMAVGGG